MTYRLALVVCLLTACGHPPARRSPDASPPSPASYEEWLYAEAAKQVSHPPIRPVDSSLHFRPTAEMPGDADVKADLDWIARVGIVESGPVGDSAMPSEVEARFFSVARRLSHTERVQLLAHESPVIRAYAIMIKRAQPDDLPAIEPLLDDQTKFLKTSGCITSGDTIAALAHRLLHH